MNKPILLACFLFLGFSALAQPFADVSSSSGLDLNRAHVLDVLDYNNDGFEDVIVQNNLSGRLTLYKNNSGQFQNVNTISGFNISSSGASTDVISYDYNNDGFQDILIYDRVTFRMLKNDCGSSFTEVTSTLNFPTGWDLTVNLSNSKPVVAISDYDKDGDIDIIVSHTNTSGPRISAMKFDAGNYNTTTDLITGFPASVEPVFVMFDYDNNSAEDILLIRRTSNSSLDQIQLYENNFSGGFSNKASTGFTNSSAFGFANIVDVNSDGFFDVMLGSAKSLGGPNKVFRNNGGDGTFTDISSSYNTYETGKVHDYFNSYFIDMENDGDQDVLWQTNGASIPHYPSLMVNNGSNIFSPQQAALLPNNTYGMAGLYMFSVLDINNDGYLDIIKPGSAQVANDAVVYQNAFSSNNYLVLKLISCSGFADPRGARVMISAGGKRQYKYYGTYSGKSAGVSASEKLYFGIGSSTFIDTLEVYWPDGSTTTEFNVAPNRTHIAYNGSCALGTAFVVNIPTNTGGDTMQFCNANEGILQGPMGFDNYTWNTGEATPDILVNREGWYYLTAGNFSTNCQATDSVYVSFPSANILEQDTSLCKGASITLNAYPRFDCSRFGAPRPIPGFDVRNVPPGYEYAGTFGGHHYYVSRTPSSWNNAAQDAINSGGTLAIVNSPEEQAFIESLAKSNQSLWLGMYRDPATRSFIWMNCEPVRYSNFVDGEPIDVPNEDYVFFSGLSCASPFRWKHFMDEDPGNPDPCFNTIFGLMEIDADAANITYEWSNGTTGLTTTLSPTSPTSIMLSVIKGGTTCTDIINIDVPDLNNQFADTARKDCINSSGYFLSAIPGMKSYKWSTGDTTQTIEITSSGRYWVFVTAPGNCTGGDTISLNLLNAAIKTPDTTVCFGANFTIRGPSSTIGYNEVYNQDFSRAPYFEANSNNNFVFNSTRVWGFFYNDSTTIRLNSLPAHDSIEVSFDLYIHDTWEGNCSTDGPDEFRFWTDTTNRIRNTFSNKAGCTQSFSLSGIPGTYPAKTGAVEPNLPFRCFSDGGTASTSKYTITRRYAHKESDLVLSWAATLLDNQNVACNESWSLDNVNVKVRRAGQILWSTGDTSQNISVTDLQADQTYWVQLGNGADVCYDTVEVKVVRELTIDILSDTVYSCANSILKTVPFGYDQYRWSNGDTVRFTNFYNPMWYKVYVTKGNCTGADSSFFATTKGKFAQPDPYEVCDSLPTFVNINWNDNCNPVGSPKNTGYTAGSAISGYTYMGEYHGHHYYIADTRSNWTTALTNALGAGGHLAVMNDTAEQRFIQERLTKNAWLGLYRAPDLKWYNTNCELLTYTNWASNQPPVDFGENYTFMQKPGCPEEFTWKAIIDDDAASTDPCASEIYGLLEIFESKRNITWLKGSGTAAFDTIYFTPVENDTFRVRFSDFEWPMNLGCQKTLYTLAVDSRFNIERDSVVKFKCEGDTATLVAPGFPFKNHIWSNGISGPICDISGFTGWLYCYVDVGNCKAYDSVYIDLNLGLQFQKDIKPIVCYGDDDASVTLTPIGGAGSGYQITWQDNGSNNPSRTNLPPGMYYVRLTDDSNCVLKDSVEITSPDTVLLLSFKAISPISCFGDSDAIVAAIPFGGDKPYNASFWINNSSDADTLIYAKKGFHYFQLVDARGCTIVDSFEVKEPQALSLSSSILKPVLCEEDSDGVVKLFATGGTAPYNYIWGTKQLDSSVVYQVKGGFTQAIVIDSNFCIDSIMVELVATAPNKCDLFIPAGFTPNGDGYNDYFVIKGISDFPENELSIYNRWGEKVFEASDYKNNWDGKSTISNFLGAKGSYLPNDTYYYVFITKPNNKAYSGYIYLTK